ncbi:MAG: DUF438 domain-containing protein [Planctomycetota bacterium]|jgi:DUF438 domain-containing protein
MAELIDNRQERIRLLKQIITGLHQGTPKDEAKRQLRELVRSTDASEIAAMEQELMAEGMPVEEVMGMCDLHSEVTREILTQRPHAPVVPGHPVDTFRQENEALGEAVTSVREAIAALCAGADGDVPPAEALETARREHGLLMDVETHYARKENLLFPLLERHGITGPSKVMWGKDDEVRTLLKGLGETLRATNATIGEWKLVRETIAEPALAAVSEMVRKEENILLPMALQALNDAEWAEIFLQSSEFGYCLVEPATEYRPAMPEAPAEGDEARKAGTFRAPSGTMTQEQLRALFAALPVDLTFVDADDRVRYFTEGRSRVFARPRTTLGRKVQHCHPPASVDTVERILDDFRAGREDACSFWIELQGRFLLIRYFALRDEEGQYVGTCEVTQDLTEERALTGQRRLLEYDSPAAPPVNA